MWRRFPVEATCQHLGAHLGYGGRVVDDCIVCPFHGWTWGPDGQNVAVPEGRTSKRRIEPWPVCERNGIIYLWHDVAGQPPARSMPDLFEDLRDEYPTGEYWDLATADSAFEYGDLLIEPRVVAENIVDPIHFRYVHHTRDLPALVDYEVTDASFMTKLRVHSRGKRNVDGPQRDDTVTLKQWGVGMAYTRFSGRDNTHSVISTTPVDAQTSTLRQTLFVEKIDGESDDERSTRIKAIESVFPEDLAIFSHRWNDPQVIANFKTKIADYARWAREAHDLQGLDEAAALTAWQKLFGPEFAADEVKAARTAIVAARIGVDARLSTVTRPPVEFSPDEEFIENRCVVGPPRHSAILEAKVCSGRDATICYSTSGSSHAAASSSSTCAPTHQSPTKCYGKSATAEPRRLRFRVSCAGKSVRAATRVATFMKNRPSTAVRITSKRM